MIKKLVTLTLFLFSYSVLAENVIYLSGDEAKKRLEKAIEAIEENPENIDELKNAGILMHQMNRKEPNKELVRDGEKYLKTAWKKNKKDYEAMAWLGSIITMKAMFETDPGKQTLYVKMGAKKMDKAIKKAPGNKIVRLTRANNSMELPPFLKRTRFAVTDFNEFLSLCKSQACEDHEIKDANAKLAQAESIVASID